jgi:biopolymer transport protein ExbD
MFINADRDLQYNTVVTVIDIAKGAGVDKIGLMTEEIAGRPTGE